ncbi:MAG: hypothetical protein WAW37_07510 [Syntrophobacteraceae bacterium]
MRKAPSDQDSKSFTAEGAQIAEKDYEKNYKAAFQKRGKLRPLSLLRGPVSWGRLSRADA